MTTKGKGAGREAGAAAHTAVATTAPLYRGLVDIALRVDASFHGPDAPLGRRARELVMRATTTAEGAVLAAAPDLLAALRDLAAVADLYFGHVTDGIADAALLTARAAIAKAEGR